MQFCTVMFLYCVVVAQQQAPFLQTEYLVSPLSPAPSPYRSPAGPQIGIPQVWNQNAAHYVPAERVKLPYRIYAMPPVCALDSHRIPRGNRRHLFPLVSQPYYCIASIRTPPQANLTTLITFFRGGNVALT